ncbi:MAG: hypothetical protein ACREXR_04040 [Gammaproteobacteria bacterium]
MLCDESDQATTILTPGDGLLLSDTGKVAQIVEFDIALSVKEGTGTKRGIGILAGAISLGSSGQSNEESSAQNRVKFCVPLSLP